MLVGVGDPLGVRKLCVAGPINLMPLKLLKQAFLFIWFGAKISGCPLPKLQGEPSEQDRNNCYTWKVQEYSTTKVRREWR